MLSFGKRLLAAGLAGAALVCMVPSAALAADDDAAKPEVTWATARSSVVNPTPNTDQNGWAVYEGRFTTPSVDEKLDDPVLKGAIDIHAHFGPDTYDRQWDAFEVAKLAQERGLRGAVFKNHWTESAGTAYLVRKYADAPGFEAFGSLSLNATVGGINPQAVRYFAEVEGRFAKVVWMPTHDSEHEVKEIGEIRPYVIVSKDGELLPEVLEVLDLISEYDLTLATGHVNAVEMLQIVKEAKKRGIERIILTHPNLGPMYTDPTIEQLKKATEMGAFAEIVTGELTGRTRAEFVSTIKTLGPEHCIIASDSGLIGSRNHADALVLAARILREEGFSEADLDLMFKANPAKVLGLPVL